MQAVQIQLGGVMSGEAVPEVPDGCHHPLAIVDCLRTWRHGELGLLCAISVGSYDITWTQKCFSLNLSAVGHMLWVARLI